MDKKELRQIQAERASKKDKRRLLMSIMGLALCIVVLFQLKIVGDRADQEGIAQQETQTQYMGMMPEIDLALLDTVKDSGHSDQVILEPVPFQHLASKALGLMGSWLYLLGEPEFPFAEAEASSADLRGKPYRLRGELLDAREVTRVAGEDAEYWCLGRTDQGDLFWFVSLMLPETLFGSDNFVLADGFFFKHYRQKQGEEWLTAPLFVGRALEPSYRAMDPIEAPTPEVLYAIKDHPLGTDNDPRQLDEDPALWDMANAARTVANDPELLAAATADSILLDDKTIEDLVQNPDIFRGRMFELGGLVREARSVQVPENPLREREMSSAWVRNDFLGDFLLHLKAPGKFDFLPDKGPIIYHGWFLMLWAYKDTKEALRRSPVFVVVDAVPQEAYTPPFAGQVVVMFLGFALAIGLLLFWLIRRDRRASDLAMRKLTERRQTRRNP